MRSYDLNGTIIYNGKSSADLGVIVNKLPVIRKPKRKGSTTSIPGRSGSLAREENGAFENYVQPYEISITDTNRGISAISGDLAAWLLNTRGYIRLEDSFDPDVYRMARFAGPFDIEPLMEQDGKTVIEFDCYPQRYLKTGEQEIAIANGETTMYNPTAFAANPLIRVDIDASLYPDTGDQKEITEVALEWEEHKSIGGRQSEAGSVHRVRSDTWYSMVSTPILLDGYEKAVITAQCYAKKVMAGITYDLGYFYGTCYTLLDENGNPVNGVYDTQKMKAATVNFPENAKYLVIASACIPPDTVPEEVLEPSVALYPAMSSDEKPGAFSINGVTADIVFIDRSTIYLDCDAHNAYYADGSNANAAVTFTQNGKQYATFPQLAPGDNLVTIDGTGVTATIRPRWWVL